LTLPIFPRERAGGRVFEELVAAHERMVLRTAYRLVGCLEDAQEAAQEVFLRLLGVWAGSKLPPDLRQLVGLSRGSEDSTHQCTTDRAQTPASIFTDLDVKEGQKTVVGKSSVNSAGDALILVIVPKIME
jgi:hypothetical protein